MAPCRMMVDNPMQEDRLVVPASEVSGAERTVCGWTVLAGMGWLLWIYAWAASGVVLRTLATRGRKREAPRRIALSKNPAVRESNQAKYSVRDACSCVACRYSRSSIGKHESESVNPFCSPAKSVKSLMDSLSEPFVVVFTKSCVGITDTETFSPTVIVYSIPFRYLFHSISMRRFFFCSSSYSQSPNGFSPMFVLPHLLQ